MTTINFIIPSLGRNQDLENLLNSLKTLDYSEIKAKVIVILNGCPEAFAAELESRHRNDAIPVMALYSPTKGVNRARNIGIVQSQDADLMFFLDDDCILREPSILQRHLRLHSVNPEISAFGGGYVLPERAALFDKIYNEIQMSWLLSGLTGESCRGGQLSSHLIGGNFSMKVADLKAKQILFDDGIAYGGSELEFFLRAGQMGCRFAYVDVDVEHATGESFFDLWRKLLKQGRGKAFIDSKFSQSPTVKAEVKAGVESQVGFWRMLFNYVFWYGYYSFNGRGFRVVTHFLRDIFNYLNWKRFEILKRINRD